MKLGHLTDTHLDGLTDAEVDAFAEEARASNVDAWVHTGDVASGSTFRERVFRLTRALRKPFYFVLGNHDYYGGTFEQGKANARWVHEMHAYPRWLRALGCVPLTDKVALIGHDGFADRRAGTPTETVLMGDQYLIEDMRFRSPRDQIEIAQLEAEACELSLRCNLPIAASQAEHIYIALHAPPFEQAARHHGKQTEAKWLQHFVNFSAGKVLRALANEHPTKRFTVLCGHTHDRCTVHIGSNLIVRVGGATVGKPGVAGVYELEGS